MSIDLFCEECGLQDHCLYRDVKNFTNMYCVHCHHTTKFRRTKPKELSQ